MSYLLYISLLSDNCRDLQEISQNLNRNVPQIKILKLQVPRQDISNSTAKSLIETKPNDSSHDCPETKQFPNKKMASKCTLDQIGIEKSKRVNDEILDSSIQLPLLGFTDFKQRNVQLADTDRISSREVLDFCITADLPQIEVQMSQACLPTIDSSPFISKATIESEVQHPEHDIEENILDTLGLKVSLDDKLVKIDGDDSKDRSSHPSKPLNSAPSTPIEITFESGKQAEVTQAVENLTKNPNANVQDDRDDEEVLGALVQLSTECTHHRSLESSNNIVEANVPRIKLNRSEESATHCDSLGTNDAELQKLHESVSKTQLSVTTSTASEATVVSQNSRNPDRRHEGILEIPITETLLNSVLEAIHNFDNKNDNKNVSETRQSSAVDSVKPNQNAFPSNNFDESGICLPADVLSSQAENQLMMPEKCHAANIINIRRYSMLSTNLDETRTDESIPPITITNRCIFSNNKTIIETEAQMQAPQSEGRSTDIPQTENRESLQPLLLAGSSPVSPSVKQSVFMESVRVQGNNTSSEYLQNADNMSLLTDNGDDEWLSADVEYTVSK